MPRRDRTSSWISTVTSTTTQADFKIKRKPIISLICVNLSGILVLCYEPERSFFFFSLLLVFVGPQGWWINELQQHWYSNCSTFNSLSCTLAPLDIWLYIIHYCVLKKIYRWQVLQTKHLIWPFPKSPNKFPREI